MSVDVGLIAGSVLLALAAVAIAIRVPAVLARDSSERRFLEVVFVGALLLRFGLAVVTYIKLRYGYFAPDEAGQVQAALNYLSALTYGKGEPLPSPAVHGQGWIYFNVLIFQAFGTEPLLPRFWNCLVGAVTPVLGYALAREFGAVGGARWSAIFIAVFPSMVLWSSLNLHDVDAYFMILVAFFVTTRLQRSPRWWHVVVLALTLAAMFVLRLFADSALLASVACGLVASRLRIPARQARRIALAVATAAIASIVLVVIYPSPGQHLYTRLGLSQIADIRRNLASGARSAVDTDPGLQTLLGALAFLPRGLVNFFLRPFPWEGGSTLSLLTRPETILYYALIPLVVLGIVLSTKRAASRTIPSLVFLTVTGVGYAMVISNLGTIYRERGELLIVMFVFVGVGVDAIATRWRRRRGRADPGSDQPSKGVK